jgi:hypothetical protein
MSEEHWYVKELKTEIERLTAELEQKEARINRLLFLIARKDAIIDDYRKLVIRIHSEK